MAAGSNCPYCGKALETGFLSTTNGSGLFWSHHAEVARLRPHDLEVVVGTGFGGTYSANLPAQRCLSCKKVIAALT